MKTKKKGRKYNKSKYDKQAVESEPPPPHEKVGNINYGEAT